MRVGIGSLAAFSFFFSVSFVYSVESPLLVFETSNGFQATVTRLERIDQSRFQATMDLVGLPRPGDPIRVVVASEQSEWAQRAPSWASGYAISRQGLIIILPQRVVAYPYDSLENVLSHEIAHVFTARAAKGKNIPRWFDEGVAMVAARTWDFQDGARLTWALVIGDPISLDSVDALFFEDRASAKKAYVLSHAFVRFCIQEFGRDWPRTLIALIAKGVPFQEAFFRTTLRPLKAVEKSFWGKQTVWTRWAPAVTSTLALWVGILILAMYVFKKQRQRSQAVKRKWEEENHFDL